MIRLATLALAALLSLATVATAQTVRVTADVTSNTTWTASTTYLLDGLIFVDAGATLTIEPGTVVKGVEQGNITTGDGASALIVRRGGRLEAGGRADAPIIFTAEADDVADAFDLDETDRGLWGGVVILGRAPTNANDGSGGRIDVQIEGIDYDPTAGTGEEALYGGTDPADDSGTLRYVSIRHGGFSISGVEGDEINGLTLGAVGTGTEIEYVEVYANVDDCVEWFGGTVGVKYLVGAFCGDDSFDYDQGFAGKGQFWFSIQGADIAGRAGEHDGGDNSLGGEGSAPFAIPVLSNVTYLGSGQTAVPTNDDANTPAVFFRDNAGGKYYNSVWADFPGQALRIEDLAAGADSRARLEAGDLVVANSLFFRFGAGSTLAALVQEGSERTPASVVVPVLQAAGTSVTDPGLRAIARLAGGNGLDPRPGTGAAAASGASFAAAPLGDPFFTPVAFRGAFSAEASSWLSGWTALAANGYLTAAATPAEDGPAPAAFGLSVGPNPTSGAATVRFSLDRAQDVRLSLYDVLGREVAVVAQGTAAAGEQTARIDTTTLPAGLYVLRLQGESAAATQQVRIVR